MPTKTYDHNLDIVHICEMHLKREYSSKKAKPTSLIYQNRTVRAPVVPVTPSHANRNPSSYPNSPTLLLRSSMLLLCFLIVFGHFWPLHAAFGHHWSFLATFGHLWSLWLLLCCFGILTTFKHFLMLRANFFVSFDAPALPSLHLPLLAPATTVVAASPHPRISHNRRISTVLHLHRHSGCIPASALHPCTPTCTSGNMPPVHCTSRIPAHPLN